MLAGRKRGVPARVGSWQVVGPGLLLLGAAVALAGPTDPIPPGVLSRPPSPAFLNMPLAPPLRPGQWVTVPAFPHLTFTTPTFLTYVPGTNRLIVLEREGVIKTFENDPNTITATTVLDIHHQCQGMDGCGLLGLAFHPDFGKPGSPNRGYFYICYNYSDNPVLAPNRPSPDKPTRDRLSRFTVPDGSLVADPHSELVLIDEEDRHLFHTGGGMFFHPRDGFLYLSIGDEGSDRGRLGNCQRIDKNLYGGVIRIDVDMDPARSHPPPRQPASGTTAHYYIPNDNPFVGVANALEEFWCLGLRSPHRMTCDPVTGRIWLGDVGDGGPDAREEVDLIEKGGNYQWNYREGNADRPEFAPRPAQLLGIEKPPVLEYTHTDGNSCVIGGYVYRGREHAETLGGRYIFGDFGSGRIWALDYQEGSGPRLEELCRLPASATMLSTFGLDREGELYMCEAQSDHIFKLARAGSPAVPIMDNRPIPRLLSATGTFRDPATLTPTDGLIPYSLNVPCWMDGAQASRWLSVPCSGAPGAADPHVHYAATGPWTFPIGSVFVQHLELPVDETNPSRRQRLETRLLVRDAHGSVYGAAYRWRPDQSDAELIESSQTEELTVTAATPFGSLQGSDVGRPPRSGRSRSLDGGYEVVPPQGNMGGRADRFHFLWQRRSGDFDVKVRVQPTGVQDSVAGLMARESLEPGSRHVSVLLRNPIGTQDATPQCLGLVRDTPNEPAQPLDSDGDSAGTWVRLVRHGDTCTAFTSADGIRWTPLDECHPKLPPTVYLGLAVAGGAAGEGTVTLQQPANNRAQSWSYLESGQCLTCHNATAGYILGVTTRQLNGDHLDPATGVRENQLRTWSRLGLLEPALKEEDIAGCARLVPVTDSHASRERRVRSYLDANCAHCHQPYGVRADFDARYDTPLAEQNLLDCPVHLDVGVPQLRVVAAADPARSLLYLRLKSCDALRMPPLGRSLEDTAATGLVHSWIESLPVRHRLRKNLLILGGAFLAVFLPALLLRRVLRRTWLARVLPTLLVLTVPGTGLVWAGLHPLQGRDSLVLAAVSAGLAVLSLVLFVRRPRETMSLRLWPGRRASPTPGVQAPRQEDEPERRAAG